MRLIDADVLKATFEEDGHLSGYIEEYIDSAPTIDAIPAMHGQWIAIRDKWGYPIGKQCSECGRRVRNIGENYCPKCGVRMDCHDTNIPTDRGCSTCANDGMDMPQCRECTEHPGYPWYKRRDGGADE